MAKNREADTKLHAILPQHTQSHPKHSIPPSKKLPEGLNPVGLVLRRRPVPCHVGQKQGFIRSLNFRNPFERQGKKKQKKVKFQVTVQESKMLPHLGQTYNPSI